MFLMPDYYTDFLCKMGGCRSACCEGWPISVSMKEYFSLLGLECDPNLRHRSDCGLKIGEHPNEAAYAHLEPGYDGTCPIRMADGRCALHAQLGEDVLPAVCRLYPRGLRVVGGMYECSCSNSCEAVLELLFAKLTAIQFVQRELTVQLPTMRERQATFETYGLEREIRMSLISVVQNHSMSLPERLLCLGKVLDEMDECLRNHDISGMHRLLEQVPAIKRLAGEHNDEDCLRFGLDTMEKLIAILDERSDSLRECGENALQYFGTSESSVERYWSARKHFESCFSNWEIFFENILVNHMFFSQFPFQDRPDSMHSEYAALCAVYALMRFLALGIMVDKNDADSLVDVLASAFRLIDHTSFDALASRLLQYLHCTANEQLHALVSL